MWTTIGYKDGMENNKAVRLYEDSTEKSFELYEDAVEYAAYIVSKTGLNVDTYGIKVYNQSELNIEELKKEDALSKLTEEEKQLLGIQ